MHDLAGMTSFGAIEREEDEPVFHDRWEERVLAMTLATSIRFGPIDRRRFALEQMDPAYYLQASYYERWLDRLARTCIETDLVTDGELASGEAHSAGTPTEPPPGVEAMESLIRQGVPVTRDTGRQDPRFSVGDRVRARNLNPSGHTRLPRYVRGHLGVIDRIHGTHVFPDTNARGEGENPQPLYSVRFAATELWGPSAPANDALYVDMWEDYLDAEER